MKIRNREAPMKLSFQPVCWQILAQFDIQKCILDSTLNCFDSMSELMHNIPEPFVIVLFPFRSIISSNATIFSMVV